MTKTEIAKIKNRDFETLNKTQSIYEDLLTQFEVIPPSPIKHNEMMCFNVVSNQIIKIIETKMKLKLLEGEKR